MRAPRLLVSVVDAQEAAEAARGGAHIIDAKDPSRGALGAVSARALAGILATCPGSVETSAALGDLADLKELGPGLAARAGRPSAPPGCLSEPVLPPYPERLTYIKVGLGGFPETGGARRALQDFLARRPGSTAPDRPDRDSSRGEAVHRGRSGSRPRLIVASYADHRRAGAPPPEDVPDLAAEAGAAGCLLDTGLKDGSCLLDWMDEGALAEFVRACRARGLVCALAGSLRADHMGRMARLQPDFVGVRGAACDGDRVRGRVRGSRVAALAGGLAAAWE